MFYLSILVSKFNSYHLLGGCSRINKEAIVILNNAIG